MVEQIADVSAGNVDGGAVPERIFFKLQACPSLKENTECTGQKENEAGQYRALRKNACGAVCADPAADLRDDQ